MNDVSIKTNTVVNGQNKMRKYVVEAPEPKPGQKLSSGGIREKGKMVVVYKNPVPLEETGTIKVNKMPVRVNQKVNKKADNTVYWEISKYFLEFVWRNFGERVVGAWLQEKGDKIAEAILDQQKEPKEPPIIDVEENDVVVMTDDDDKIVQFKANKPEVSAKG